MQLHNIILVIIIIIIIIVIGIDTTVEPLYLRHHLKSPDKETVT